MHPLWEQKLYSVVSVPLGVILKIVPTVGSASSGCPVEVPIGGLDQPRCGPLAVRAAVLSEQKLYSVVSVPLGVILKTVPSLLAPPQTLSRRSPHWWPGPAPLRDSAVRASSPWEQEAV